MSKKIYYMLMTAGYFAIAVMLGIIVMLVTSCSPLMLPDKGIDLTVPPTITGEEYFTPTEETVCCVPDKDFPLSCGGWKLCEFNSQGDLI